MWTKPFGAQGWATEGHLANLPEAPGMFEKPVATVSQTPCDPVEQLVVLLGAHDLLGTAGKTILPGVPLQGQRLSTSNSVQVCRDGCERGDGEEAKSGKRDFLASCLTYAPSPTARQDLAA